MKKLFALGLAVAACGSAQAQILFDNGPVVSGTPPISVIRAGGTLFGAGAQGALTPIPNTVAEDFSVSGPGWIVQSLSFYGYQTGANSVFTFTGANWSIVSGDVNTGTVVASGANAAVTNGGLLGYRVTSTTLGDTARAIFQVNVDVPDFTLAPGNYFLRWNLTGSLASGPWQPPTSDGEVGNAFQATSTSAGSFIGLIDAGDGLGVSLPFTIQGSVVPEPGTYALMLAGGLAVLTIARRRRQG